LSLGLYIYYSKLNLEKRYWTYCDVSLLSFLQAIICALVAGDILLKVEVHRIKGVKLNSICGMGRNFTNTNNLDPSSLL